MMLYWNKDDNFDEKRRMIHRRFVGWNVRIVGWEHVSMHDLEWYEYGVL